MDADVDMGVLWPQERNEGCIVYYYHGAVVQGEEILGWSRDMGDN